MGLSQTSAKANDYNQHDHGQNAIAVNTRSRYIQSHCPKWTPWQSICALIDYSMQAISCVY